MKPDEIDMIRHAAPSLDAAAPALYRAVQHFIYALDHGFLACEDDSSFIDGLRAALEQARTPRSAVVGIPAP
jgi:hypothetical protein